MAATQWLSKDPAEVKDYTFNWSGHFTYDYIVTSTWAITVGAGLVINSNTFTDNTSTVVLSAGTANVVYTIVNTIVTSKGRTFKQAATLTATIV